jgi:DNA-binding NarL/FixJ family response regulator
LTVKTHVRNILHKFELRNKKQLRRALDDWDFHNWLKPPA